MSDSLTQAIDSIVMQDTIGCLETVICRLQRMGAVSSNEMDVLTRIHARISTSRKMPFVEDDGGRQAAGYKGSAGDCVVRSIAIATGKPYQEVYDAINVLAKQERLTKRRKTRSTARDGVWRDTIKKYMTSIGWEFHSTMHIGSGCKVHLAAGELPNGRIIVSLSKHFSSVIDGVIHDTYDPSRDGTRCVYGYYCKVTVSI